MTPAVQVLANEALESFPGFGSELQVPFQGGHATRPAVGHVLVLDGDGDRQELISDIVARAGGDAETAATGAEAVETMQGREPNAILVTGLPDGTRRGFVSWARPRFPDVAIVAVAESAQEATDLYHAGADLVTTLPLDADLLGAKLAAALRRTSRPHLRLVPAP